jgi:penicillin amidase
MRKAFRMLAFLLALGAAALVLGYVYLRQSLPQLEGEISLAGLAAPVEILRDAYGVPHIFAQSQRDAHFALGFVHAQDRLWQLEMNRRIGAGRLAEVLGPRALETDRFMRTLGVRRAAQANLGHLDEETRAALDAYAQGVNAFLATGPVLPPEFLLLGVRPQPWTAVDSLAWAKMMAWDLGGSWRNELLRVRLSRVLPMARVHEFLPPYPGDAPPALRDLKDLYEGLEREPPRIARGSDPDFPDPDSGAGSNSWVVSAARSASGKPLLANDPHLALTAPAVWYLAHLHAPGLNAIGATLPGMPGVLVGRNDRIAWGSTNTGPDVQDLYLEKLDTAGNYLTPEGPRAFETMVETIRVRGGSDETLHVRVSRHGPVISDVVHAALELTPRGHAMALAWTALAPDDLSMQAALRVGRARNWSEFEAALRLLHAPQQTITYADVDGNIGFLAAGRVPVRKPENDLKGLAPAPGWDARYDWAGYVPFEALPRAFNPAAGALVSANHKVTPPGYAHHITFEWQPPYRARRIEELLLLGHGKHSIDSFARMQLDTVSLAVRELLPHLLSARPRNDAGRDALKLLASWDGDMAAARPEPLIVVAWWRELALALYGDELGDAFRGRWSTRAPFVENALRTGSAWCDDVRSRPVERCEQVLSDSLDRALQDLKRRFGADPGAWKWGEAHPAWHRHRPLSRSEALARLFDLRVPSPGDAYSINVGRSDFNDDAAPYASIHAASYRALYDLADPQGSLFIHSGGQSGNPLSPHYRAFTEAWSRGEYIRTVTDRSMLEAAGVRRLALTARR